MESLNKHVGTSDHAGRPPSGDFLTDLLMRFINIPADQLDFAIEDAQRRICELYNLDRSTLWQWSLEDPDVILLTHIHQPAASPPIARTTDTGLLSDGAWVLQTADIPTIYMRMDGKAFFPWLVQKITSGEPVIISRLDDLPEEAAYDREMLLRYGTKSTTLLPVSEGEKNLGVLGFASLNEEKALSGEQVASLTLVAQVFANALGRKRNELNLRIAEARLTLAAESAEADLWNMVVHTGQFWVSDIVRKKYGVAPHEVFTLEMLLGFIHSEDRGEVVDAVQEAIQSGQLVSVEYRITYADGTMHWHVSRGRIHGVDAGEFSCLMGVTLDISERKQMEEQLRKQCQEIELLKNRLEEDNLYLQGEIKSLVGYGRIICNSAPMKSLIGQARQVAGTDSTVLILGETGTGKELLARAIHDMSARNGRPLITVNCASLPPTLIEAELFGREKGAYTGALTRMIGRFELADRSTIFLDEIGELPLELQAKLLRVIEDGGFQRLGSTKTIAVNIRVIAATNRNLFEEVKSGRFRSDLYYRLNVFPLPIPPLRERPEDIPPLVWSLVREFHEAMGKKIDRIPEKTMNALTSYDWPGNVRELRNVIERAMIVSVGTTLEVRMPEIQTKQKVSHGKALRDVERDQILAVLAGTRWKVAGKGGAAELLDLERTTLYSKMKKLGIKRPSG
jgi:PAS domain S-box-containing protein